MKEHVHEWRPSGSYDDCEWDCECGKILEGEEITRRLNAVERLSAEDATIAAVEVKLRLPNRDGGRLQLALDAYASALKEKTP